MNCSTSRRNRSSPLSFDPNRRASLVALFTVPATTVLFTPLTTGDGVGASLVICGIIDAAPSASASSAFVAPSRARFSRRPSLVDVRASPRRNSATKSTSSFLSRGARAPSSIGDDARASGARASGTLFRGGVCRACRRRAASRARRGAREGVAMTDVDVVDARIAFDARDERGRARE